MRRNTFPIEECGYGKMELGVKLGAYIYPEENK